MHRETIYDLWAPALSLWSLWVRPSLFAQWTDTAVTVRAEPWPTFDVAWVPDAHAQTVLLIDLPAAEAVWWSLAIAQRGYRPVPVYEVCTGPHELIDQRPILQALRTGAAYLQTVALAANAPPAFLVDARRMNPPGGIRPRAFDNRWRVSPFDFPSAGFLTAQGLARVLLVQQGRGFPQKDLACVLRAWQEAGISLLTKNLASVAPPKPLAVTQPAWVVAMWERTLAKLGLSPGGAEGFGITT